MSTIRVADLAEMREFLDEINVVGYIIGEVVALDPQRTTDSLVTTKEIDLFAGETEPTTKHRALGELPLLLLVGDRFSTMRYWIAERGDGEIETTHTIYGVGYQESDALHACYIPIPA